MPNLLRYSGGDKKATEEIYTTLSTNPQRAEVGVTITGGTVNGKMRLNSDDPYNRATCFYLGKVTYAPWKLYANADGVVCNGKTYNKGDLIKQWEYTTTVTVTLTKGGGN